MRNSVPGSTGSPAARSRQPPVLRWASTEPRLTARLQPGIFPAEVSCRRKPSSRTKRCGSKPARSGSAAPGPESRPLTGSAGRGPGEVRLAPLLGHLDQLEDRAEIPGRVKVGELPVTGRAVAVTRLDQFVSGIQHLLLHRRHVRYPDAEVLDAVAVHVAPLVVQRTLAVHLDQLHLRTGTGHRDVDAVVRGAPPVSEVAHRVRSEVVPDPTAQAQARAP